MPYTISDAAMADMITEAGYVAASLSTAENSPHPGLALAGLHKHLNAAALILANACIDTSTGNPVASDTFGGSGNISGTSPQSGGIAKNP